MSLFVNADLLPDLGNGTIGVYFSDDGNLVCGGFEIYTGDQIQIVAWADDATTEEKDGFSAGESIIWKFEDNNGNQYDLTPSPQDGFALNGISFISGFQYEVISCGDEDDISCEYLGCTDVNFTEFNPIATIDDGSCATAVVFGCTDTGACNYSSSANTDDGSCLLPSGCETCDGNGGVTTGETLVVEMYDSYGDGWNQNTFEVAGQSLTLESGSEGTA